MSRRKFSFFSEDRIRKLQQIQLKKKSESKVNWAVTAYNKWRENRLYNFNYDIGIYETDLNKLDSLTKENLLHAMCRCVPEVVKKKGDGPYPGSTLHQMVVAIQKHLNVNKIPWKLIDDPYFVDLKVVLDNVMKEHTAMNVGVTKKQAQVISYETENRLWDEGILGEDSPDKLRNTVLFLLGINVFLRAVEEHYNLRRCMPTKESQITFERDSKGVKCLVYREDHITKTHDGGMNDLRKERKIVWVYPSSNISRCPVRLTEKYLSLCPPYYRKSNFYLQLKQKVMPSQWYCEQVVGQNTISKVVKKLMEEAKIEGFFTNHSLRRTGGTRLFRAGMDRKIVKEHTGHRSDAMDAYQITSEEQRQNVSNILCKKPSETASVPIVEGNEKDMGDVDVDVDVRKDEVGEAQIVVKQNEQNKVKCTSNVDVESVGEIINSLVRQTGKKGKTVIKLEIEISHE